MSLTTQLTKRSKKQKDKKQTQRNQTEVINASLENYTSHGLFSKQAEQCQINNIQNFDKISSTNSKAVQIYARRRRGRPPRGAQNLPQTTNSLYHKQLKKRKIQNIQAYQKTLQKLRAECVTFYSPFQKVNLNINKQKVLQNLKNAKELKIKVRETVRQVGVRHQRNLFKYGVQQQLKFIIEYLQTGKIPKWMKQHFQQLLQKDFSKPHENQMYPTMF